MNVTRRSLGSHNPPAGFNDYAECINKTAANTFINFMQALETSTCIPLRGKQITVSFYARAAANTDKSKVLLADVISTTSTDTKTGGSVVGSELTANLTFGTAATDWQRFSFSVTVPSDAGTLRVRLRQAPTGGLAVDDGFHITGVQLETGPVATPFEFEPYEATLRKCQRYYTRMGETNNGFPILQSYLNAAGDYSHAITFPTTLRVSPTSTVNGAWATSNCATPTIGFVTKEGFALRTAVTAGGAFITHPNSTDDWIAFDAEL
jgi:hypothetical protein